MKNSAEKPRRRLKKGAVNALQNLAIVLLLIVGIGLSAAGGLLPADAFALWFRDRTQAEEADDGYAPAASPYCIVVTPQDGAHSAVMYSAEELDDTYGRFSAMLGEALGSSHDAQAVSEEQWRSALGGRGVYFDFYNDFLLSTYAIWLGTTMTGEASGHTARRICLAIEDGEVALYYIRPRANDGRYYFRCDTALPADALAAQLGTAVPNGAEFCFERGAGYELIDPYFVMTADTPQVYSASAHNSLSDLGEAEAMAAFGMNSYLAQSYPEADGTLIWVDGDATIRIGTDGTLYYSSRQPEPGEEARLGPAAAIEFGRSIVEQTLGSVSGDASLQLSYMWFDEATESYLLRFNYELNGLPVELQGGQSAAEIMFVGSTVYYAMLHFRAYTLENTTENVLPVDMAASIANSQGGGEPRLSYIDSADGVSVNWPVK